jgi:hypothetical protein
VEGHQRIIGDRKRREGRYIVFIHCNTDFSISLASTGVDTALWHHRMGHMSEKGM